MFNARSPLVQNDMQKLLLNNLQQGLKAIKPMPDHNTK